MEGTFNTLSKIAVVAAVLLLWGCAVKTQIIEPDGSTYTIKSKGDALVVMKIKDREITVDNRGNPNMFQSIVEWLLLKTPDTVLRAKGS